MKHILEIIYHKITKTLDLFDSALMLIGSYTLGQYKDFLGIIGLGITMVYTIWKWRKEWLEVKSNK